MHTFSLAARLLSGAALLLSSHLALAQTPSQRWDRSFGGTDEDRLAVVLPTADGGYVLGGSSRSGATGSKTQASRGNFDYWVVKLDASGTKLWDYTFGGSGEDRLSSLAPTADGGFVLAGHSLSGASGDKTQGNQGGFDLWVVKLTASGTKSWDRSFGSGGDDRLAAVHQTADGGFVLGAQTLSGPSGDRSQAGQGGLDYWVLKLDANGTKLWDRSLGGSNNDILNALQPTYDGGYLLGGFSYSPASGDKSQGTRGGTDYDYWVVKLDSAGTRQWDGTFGGTGFDNLTSLTPTHDHGYLLGGFSNSGISGEKSQASRGDYDNWVVKLDSAGRKQWDRTFGGDGYDSLNGLQETADHGFLLGSQSNSAAVGDKTQPNLGASNTPDYWVVKLDSAGTKQWDGTYGGSQEEVLTSLRQAADGSFLLGGLSNSGISGSKTQAGQGNFDFWVVKLAAVPTATHSGQPGPGFALYPNPARQRISLELPPAISAQRLELLDATGRCVRRLSPAPAGATRLTLNLEGLAPGNYWLCLSAGSGPRQVRALRVE